MKQGIGIFIVVAIIGLVTAVIHSWNTRKTPPERKSDKRPNILFVIAVIKPFLTPLSMVRPE